MNFKNWFTLEVKTLQLIEPNTGRLELNELNSKSISIKRGRFEFTETNESHPLYDEENKYFKRIYCLEYRKNKIYCLNLYGKKDSVNGYHIGLNYFQFNKFLWLQKQHWFQKEENIRYCINIVFLIIGLWLSIKKL
jgi:hypothetical protein